MAKKNKKKNRPEGFDPNQRKRERIEQRRQAKAEALARRRKQERRERIVRRLGLLALAVFLLWFFFVRGGVPDEILGREIEHYSTSAGNPTHVETPVDYTMSPPVSGAHAGIPAECGTHGAAIPNENLVHSLEHGAVAVLYSPTIPQEEVRQVEELVASYDSHTISAPYEGEMETPIAVAAWANIMRLGTFDEEAIREFVDAFAAGGQAPEAYQDCPNDRDDDFEVPESPEPSPGQSPEPDATKSPGADAPRGSPRPGRGGGDAEETPAP
ncbi:MAG TPA: DUF3105 domain-containing protein [Actinomycetota bacterium]|nr:DUF3105 domain-containing protein [Actinomycetota bacterium]